VCEEVLWDVGPSFFLSPWVFNKEVRRASLSEDPGETTVKNAGRTPGRLARRMDAISLRCRGDWLFLVEWVWTHAETNEDCFFLFCSLLEAARFFDFEVLSEKRETKDNSLTTGTTDTFRRPGKRHKQGKYALLIDHTRGRGANKDRPSY